MRHGCRRLSFGAPLVPALAVGPRIGRRAVDRASVRRRGCIFVADGEGTPTGGGRRKVEILGKRLSLLVPADGLGVTSDAVLLAAAVDVRPGMRLLDAGCGVGPVALSVAVRVPGLELHGLEIDPELAALARVNLNRNRSTIRCLSSSGMHVGDVFRLPSAVTGRFDAVVTNPPWQKSGGGSVASDRRRVRAVREGGFGRGLAEWLLACRNACRPEGCVTALVPWERLEELLARLGERGAEALPLVAREGRSAVRALVRLRCGEGSSFVLHSPVVLHRGVGYDRKVERVLREGARFPWPAAAGEGV